MSNNNSIDSIFEQLLHECLMYPMSSVQEDVEISFKHYLGSSKISMRSESFDCSGNIEYAYAATKFLIYQEWLNFVGYVDTNEWCDVIKKNLDNLSEASIELFAKYLLNLSNYTTHKVENSSGDIDEYWCKDNDRFENISRESLLNLIATVLTSKIETEIKSTKLFLNL